MAKALAPFAALVVAAGTTMLVGPGGAAAVDAPDAAEELPARDDFDLTYGAFNALSCPAAGECVAVGSAGWSSQVALMATSTAGTWGSLVEVPGLATLDAGGKGSAVDVTCTAIGDCAVVGSFGPGGSTVSAFVASSTNGTWTDAIEVPGIAALNTGALAGLVSVACTPDGTCAAGGSYRYGASNNLYSGFITTRTNGVWSNAVEVPGLGSLNTGDNARVNHVSCGADGSCSAIGTYKAGTKTEGFVADMVNGTWQNAVTVPGLAALNQGSVSFEALSCPAAGECTAAGRYWDGSQYDVFVVSQVNGVWGQAVSLPGFAGLLPNDPHNDTKVTTIACPAPGECSVVGEFGTPSFADSQMFVASMVGGVWQTAQQATWDATLVNVTADRPTHLACSAPGECLAVGTYRDGSVSPAPYRAFAMAQTAGTWAPAQELAGVADLNSGANSYGTAVTCIPAGPCAAGGYFLTGYRFFVAANSGGGASNVVLPPPPPPTTTTAPTTTTTPPSTTTVPTPTVDATGEPPRAEAGELDVTVDGAAQQVEVTIENADQDLVVRSDTFELRLTGECTSGCTITEDAAGRAVLELDAEGAVRVEANGFAADSPVAVWMYSEPVLLGTGTVSADGRFTGTFTLPDVAPGTHTIQVLGTTANGSELAATLGVRVVEPVGQLGPVGQLPETGPGTTPIDLVLFLAAGGALLVVLSRRGAIERP